MWIREIALNKISVRIYLIQILIITVFNIKNNLPFNAYLSGT